MKSDVYDYVTERIIDRLEQGEVPWINTRIKPLLLARSATTGRVYRGINTFLLSRSSPSSLGNRKLFSVRAERLVITSGSTRLSCLSNLPSPARLSSTGLTFTSLYMHRDIPAG